MDSPDPSIVGLADGSLRMLDPDWPKVDALSWWITAAIACVVAVIGLLITWLTDEVDATMMAVLVTACAALIILLVLGAWRWPRLAYRHTHYIVSPQGIEIRRGVIWRSVTNVPRSRIQHTDVTQGPIMRRYNLATLVMHTAGTQYAIVTLPGLSHEVAIRLRDFLIRGSETDAV